MALVMGQITTENSFAPGELSCVMSTAEHPTVVACWFVGLVVARVNRFSVCCAKALCRPLCETAKQFPRIIKGPQKTVGESVAGGTICEHTFITGIQ
jgi:hypothetical protein